MLTQEAINERRQSYEIICDKSIEILQATNDGDDLTASELWLVQEAVNEHLNDKGLQAFNSLYNTVKK